MILPIPETKVETYLAKIAGDDVELPIPETKVEAYLAKFAGDDIELPIPETKVEVYLKEIATVGPGIIPTGTIDISSNGTHDVTAFASASVMIPASAIDSGTKSISTNGVHDVIGFANVDVNIQTGNEQLNQLINRTISSISSNVNFIGSYAFANCLKLTNISFPNCGFIDRYAFMNCASLTEIEFKSCTEVANYAFSNCLRLTNISFPACTHVYEGAFNNCTALSNVFMPSCATIDTNAFNNCVSISTLSFSPYYIVLIRSLAFQSCYNLLSLYIGGRAVASLVSTDAFLSTPIAGYTATTSGVYGSIYVPASLYNSYLTASNWSDYSSRIVSM